MKVVFLSPKFYPDIGGVEKHAFEVAKLLAKRNEVAVITEGKRDKKEKIGRIKIFRFHFGKKNWFRKFIIWGKILKYRKIIERADIVHCHDVFFWYIPLRIIYPGKKVFITFHGYETVFPPTAKAIFIRKLSEKLSNGNIAIGEYIKKWYGTNPNTVVYGASESQSKTHKFRRKGKLRILFIGRIEKDTGVEIYSEVLKRLKNYKFEACGDGTLRENFNKFGKVHGFVKDLDKYIKRADIIFTSSYLSMIYAMKQKKAIFAVFNNPLKEDYLKMTPFGKWVYTAGSVKILERKIKKAVKNNKQREKNIDLSYNWVREQTWKQITEKYISLWNHRI